MFGGRLSEVGISNPQAGALPEVKDPEATYAAITRQDYVDYVNNYRPYEEQLLDKAKNDTSLIDAAREDSAAAPEVMRQSAARSVSRFGANLTPAQLQQQERGLQRQNTLGGIQAISDARIAQRENNQALMSDLINIGQGVNRSSLSQLGSEAANANARGQAYDSAKAQSKAQTYSTIGTLGSAAIMAAFLI